MLDEMVIAGNEVEEEDDDMDRKVVVISEQPVDQEEVERDENNMDMTENLLSIPEYSQEEEMEEGEVKTSELGKAVKVVPYQIKVCDSNGQTLQLLNNSQFTLKSLPQSLNLIQNGKQQTILLLANNDDEENIHLEFDNSGVEQQQQKQSPAKSMPVVAE